MRWYILILISCLSISVLSSPIINTATSQSQDLTSDTIKTNIGTGRQAEAGAQAPAAASEDDDDDDDEDELDELGDVESDDDDDEDDEDEEGGGTAASDDDDDEDDEDEGDYFERFFDDILGDDDDDDDDEDESPSQSVPVSPQTVHVPQDVANDLAPGEQSLNDVQYDDEDTQAEESANVVATIDNGVEKEPSTQAPVQQVVQVVQPVAPAQPSTSDEDDDDDDDDDEDDLDIEEDDDDDDDDDDEDDDDDDDDEEDDIEDVIEGRKARADQVISTNVPPVYITKYNRFVDTILEKVNKVLRSGYDPVNVRLHSVPKDKDDKNKKKKGTKKGQKQKKKNNKRKSEARQLAHAIVEAIRESTEAALTTIPDEDFETTTLVTEVPQLAQNNVTINETVTSTTNSTKTENNTKLKNKVNSRARPQNKKQNKNKNKKNKNKNKKGDKNKNKVEDNKPRAKATMYGLSTLRRIDDVTVNMMTTHNTVKCKFSIGPLILRVEKEFGRGVKKEIRSATATTAEMHGKMNLRVVHGGAATLQSMRVMQPEQMRVESIDDHDKTREFVWRRSFHIAEIVSQKLSKATRSLLSTTHPVKSKPKPKPSGDSGFLSAIFS